MGREYEELEEKYQRLVADKTAAEGRVDITDEEKTGIIAGLDADIRSVEESIVELGRNAKQEIMDSTAALEEQMRVNNEFLEKSKNRIAELQSMIDEETAKGEEADLDKIKIYEAEIKGIKKEMPKATRAVNAAKRGIKENNKKLIPIMNTFKDKGIFTPEEIDKLEKLEKKIEGAKRNFAKKEEPATTEPPATEEPVAEEPVAEEPVVEEPVAEEPAAPVVEGEGTDGERTPDGTAAAVVTEGGSAATTSAREAASGVAVVGTGAAAGARTAATGPAVSAPSTRTTGEVTREEWEDLYRAAQGGVLTDRDVARLNEILSKPENYEKLGITTGVFRNQVRVVFREMGYQMSRGCNRAVSACHTAFGIAPEDVKDANVVPTAELKSWRGIKGLIKNRGRRTNSQAVFDKVIAEVEARGGVETLNDDERAAYEMAVKYRTPMKDFRASMDGYNEIRSVRNKSFMGRFFGKTRKPLLVSAEEIVEPATPESEAPVSVGDHIIDVIGDHEEVIAGMAAAGAMGSRTSARSVEGREGSEPATSEPEVTEGGMLEDLREAVISEDEVVVVDVDTSADLSTPIVPEAPDPVDSEAR